MGGGKVVGEGAGGVVRWVSMADEVGRTEEAGVGSIAERGVVSGWVGRIEEEE